MKYIFPGGLSNGLGLGMAKIRPPLNVIHYYADSENGDDGNDGLTPETAFETLSEAQTYIADPEGWDFYP